MEIAISFINVHKRRSLSMPLPAYGWLQLFPQTLEPPKTHTARPAIACLDLEDIVRVHLAASVDPLIIAHCRRIKVGLRHCGISHGCTGIPSYRSAGETSR